jgi:glycerol-3-phosphate acyltransferase PlsY
LIITSYLLGSISFAYVAGRIAGGIDLRRHGSGNLGATNVMRVLGPLAAILVIIGDAGKGFMAVKLGALAGGNNPLLLFACGIAAICGHNWPLFLSFRGGKGIATSLGVLLAIMPLAVIPPALVFVLAVVFTRYVSLGSILAAITFPITVILMRQILAPQHFVLYIASSLVVAAFALYRHLPNLKRLLSGKEHKIGERVTVPDSDPAGVHNERGRP